MSSKSKKLGNLADIFQTESLEGTICKININNIKPALDQPRLDRKKGIEELAESLKNDGLLQPIVVTKNEDNKDYIIIAGERRYHAAKLLNWDEIECKILDKDKKEIFKLAVIENLQRENLSPYEEVEAMHFLKNHHNYTDSELGELFGKSRNYMSELLSITNHLSKNELNICKDKGVESKNLLVQAAKAAKNGDFSKFIQMFEKGELSTVKEAKDFNKNSTKSKETNKNTTTPDISIIQTHDTLTIRSDDPTIIKDIYSWLYKKYLSHK